MTTKINIGDLVIDHSDKDSPINIGYICSLFKDNTWYTKRNKTTYQIYWLQPDPGYGDFYTLSNFKNNLKNGDWEILSVKKDDDT